MTRCETSSTEGGGGSQTFSDLSKPGGWADSAASYKPSAYQKVLQKELGGNSEAIILESKINTFKKKVLNGSKKGR